MIIISPEEFSAFLVDMSKASHREISSKRGLSLNKLAWACLFIALLLAFCLFQSFVAGLPVVINGQVIQ